MMNQVILAGHVKDKNVRIIQTANDLEVIELVLQTKINWLDKYDKEQEKITDHKVKYYRTKNSDKFVPDVGDLVLVIGANELEKWTKDGTERSRYIVKATTILKMDKITPMPFHKHQKTMPDYTKYNSKSNQPAYNYDEDIPF